MASNKMDMSLDQIIKLQNKEKKQTSFKTQNGGGASTSRGGRVRGGGTRGRGRGARRGGLKVGVVTGLRTRRLGLGVGGGTHQRLAQNLVKRAMLQRRRQAISARNAINAGQAANGQASNTQRLLQEMRRWKQTAQVLQTALVQQQSPPNRVRLRRPGNNFSNVQNRNSIQNRLGWRGGRGSIRRGVNPRVTIRQNQPFARQTQPRRSGAFGQMQSDVLSREQARQQRLANEIMSQTLQSISGRARGRGRGRVRRQIFTETNVQVARNSMNRRFGGGQSFDSQQLRQIGGIVRSNFAGRRGRGAKRGMSIRTGGTFGNERDTVNTFRSTFASSNSGGTTLNERFGGGGGAGVGVNVSGRGRGRGGGRGGRGRRYINY